MVVGGLRGRLYLRDSRLRGCSSETSDIRSATLPKAWGSSVMSRTCAISAYGVGTKALTAPSGYAASATAPSATAAGLAAPVSNPPAVVTTITNTVQTGVVTTSSGPAAGSGSGSGSGGGAGSGGGSNSSTANLWVSPSGGSCERQATAGAEVASHDCGSLGAAYAAASCGDVINIDAGTYSADQSLADKPALDSCASRVTMEAAPGVSQSSVVFSTISSGNGTQGNTNGASNWVLRGVTAKTMINVYPPSTNVTVDDVHGGTMTITATNNVTVQNSNFGPCYNLITLPAAQNNDNGQPGPTYSPNPAVTCNSNFKINGTWTQQSGQVYDLNGLTITNDVIHDFIDDNSNTSTDHFECMFINGGSNITIDSTKFYDCQIYSIFLQPFSGYPISGLTIQNDWFWANQNASGSCASNGCSSVGAPRNSAVDFGESTSTDVTNVLVRYNSFDPADGIMIDGTNPGPGTNIRFLGNIFGNSGYLPCLTNASYGYNVWFSAQSSFHGTCGTGDVNNTATSPFVSTGNSGNTLDDLHLICNSYPQNYVTANTTDYQLNFDAQGETRATNGPRDAGAEAATSCGT